ncbi:MAG: heme-binding protein [Hyphomonadaceae bacterium]|nr:heme-binding protein [Hyphomonadaceae bacterium]
MTVRKSGARAGAAAFLLAAAVALGGCGGGGGGGGAPAPAPAAPAAPAAPPANLYTLPAARQLSAADVERVVAQAVNEAQARGLSGVVSVVDRVGNVLAVFTMTGASPTQLIPNGPAGTAARDLANLATFRNPTSGNFDVQGVPAPRALAAIAKAVTGAYLSSTGNAFSTRTASMIVQAHFPPSPATANLESGPLSGVQFSALPCSDLVTRYASGGAPGPGPRRSPLGLSADPGGFPLYKDGVVVGGVGVSMDATYGFDPNVIDLDADPEEFIALAGTVGFEAPDAVRADRIAVDGTTLRYADATRAGLLRDPAAAPALASLPGALTTVAGYFGQGAAPAALGGVAYGAEASGVRQATAAEYANRDIFVLTDGAGANRFPPTAGADGPAALTANEVRVLAEEAFAVMTSARAQIRRPLDSRAQVTIAIVDTTGAILALVRAPDAPVFGIDVSVQKARTAMFFSGAFAGDELLAAAFNPALGLGTGADPAVGGFVGQTRAFFGQPTALTGATAFAARSVGNIARPYFPDGQVGAPNGPLARPITQWSIFSTGLQSALVYENVVQHVTFTLGATPDTPARCTFLPAAGGRNRLQNGIQIFPGGVPIYRGATLVGGIGVSGDGIDQDDMIAFLGVHRAGQRVGGVGNAPAAIRADQITVSGARLRYVSCPFAPFLDSSEQNACQGK